MNYLFVMQRFIQSAEEVYTFPLGSAYVSSSLKQVSSSVHNLNLNVNMGSIEEELKEAIKTSDADVLLIGGLSPQFNQIREIIDIAKKINPKMLIMVGGGMLTASPQVIMKGIPNADIGMIGEGEEVIQELHKAIHSGNADLSKIKGIVYRDGDGTIIQTEDREDIQNLDALPFPDYDGFLYQGGNSISICTSRSCPYNCTFCFHTCGKKYRSRSLDNIFLEIDWLVEKYHIKHLGILDELFSVNVKKMSEFCDRIKDYGITWDCQMRVDGISYEILKKMKDSGCDAMSFGIENANNSILKSMEKHITIEQIEHALQVARKAGINPFGNLLLGDKDDTVETFERCLTWYNEHPALQLGFTKIMVLPGSKLYQYAVANGFIKDEVAYLKEEKFAINVTKMSDKEYNECVHRMDQAVILRKYLGKDAKVMGIDRKAQKILLEVACPSCGEIMNRLTSDFSGAENCTCAACGQYLNIDLYGLFKERIERELEQLLEQKQKKIAIWGMGNEGMRIASSCSFLNHKNVYLVDKDVAKQGERIQDKVIQSPSVLYDKEIELVLIGTKTIVTNLAIERYIKTNCRNIKRVENINSFLYTLIGEIDETTIS